MKNVQLVDKRRSPQSLKKAPALSFIFDDAISALNDIRAPVLDTAEKPVLANLLSENFKFAHAIRGHYIKPGTRLKKSTFCLACCEKEHRARDRQRSLHQEPKKRGRPELNQSDIRDFRSKPFREQ